MLVVPAQALAPANRDSRRTEHRKSETRQVTGVEPPLRCRLACCRWNKLDFDAAFCAIVRDLQEELPEIYILPNVDCSAFRFHETSRAYTDRIGAVWYAGNHESSIRSDLGSERPCGIGNVRQRDLAVRNHRVRLVHDPTAHFGRAHLHGQCEKDCDEGCATAIHGEIIPRIQE